MSEEIDGAEFQPVLSSVDTKDLPGLADVLPACYHDVEGLRNLTASPSSFLSERHLGPGRTRSPLGSISEIAIPSSPLIRRYRMSDRGRLNHLPRSEWSMELDW